MNNVTITISGSVGTGKSSIAKYIDFILAPYGFSIINQDEDEVTLNQVVTRMEAVGEKTGITIKTAQTIRESL